MRYHVEFEVTPEHLGEVLTTLAGKVEHLRVNERQESEPKKIRRSHYSKKPSESTGGKLVLESINGGSRSLRELAQVFAENNLSPTSASPACTGLVKQGLVKRVGVGLYARA